MRLISLVLILSLTGCAGERAQSYTQEMLAKGQVEDDAISSVDEHAKTECAGGQLPERIPRREYIAYNECRAALARSIVAPLAVYPDLLNKFILASVESAEQYGKGEISYSVLSARELVARDEYTKEWQDRFVVGLEKMAAQDRAESAAMSAMLQDISRQSQVNRPQYSQCNVFGNTMNCTSY